MKNPGIMLRASAVALLALGLNSGCGDDFTRGTEGNLSITSDLAQIRFDSTQPGRNDEQTLQIQNDGTGPLEVRNIYLFNNSREISFATGFVSTMLTEYNWDWDSSSPVVYEFTTHPPFELQTADRLAIELQFNPDDGDPECPAPTQLPGSCGMQQESACGALVIETNDRDLDQQVFCLPLVLNQSAGRIDVDPTAISFPTPVPGQSYTERFSVRNTGNGPLTVREIVIPTVDGLTVNNTSSLTPPFPISPNGETEYQVNYSPPDADPLNTTLTIKSDDPRGLDVIVSISSGGGGAADVAVSPDQIDLGEIAVGSTGEALFDVSNEGDAPLTWSMRLADIDPTDARGEVSLRTGDDQEITSSNQETLQVGQTRTFKIVFEPTEERPVSGDVLISSNDPDERQVRIPFFGGPPAPQISVEPLQVFYGGVAAGDIADRELVIRNLGRSTLTVTNVEIANDSQGEFAHNAPDGSFTVGPGGARAVTVTYARAEDDVGTTDRANLRITSDSPGQETTEVLLFAFNDESVLPPTACIEINPGEPYSVGDTITLNAECSEANAGELTTNPYTWALVPPDGSEVELSSDFSVTTTLSPDVSGTYRVILTVSALVGESTVQAQRSVNLLVNE